MTSKLYDAKERSKHHKPSGPTVVLKGSYGKATKTGEPFLTKNTKLTVAETPKPRYEPAEGFVGGFIAEWKRLRGIK
jgi:hypothetical protein